jgi:hypothetical protein
VNSSCSKRGHYSITEKHVTEIVLFNALDLSFSNRIVETVSSII